MLVSLSIRKLLICLSPCLFFFTCVYRLCGPQAGEAIGYGSASPAQGGSPFINTCPTPPPSNELLLVGLAARRPNAKRRGSQEAAILSNRKRYSKAEAAALSNQKELQEAKDWRRTEEAVILNNRNQFYINQSSPNNSVRENSLFGAGVGVGSCHSMARTDRLNARVPRSPTE